MDTLELPTPQQPMQNNTSISSIPMEPIQQSAGPPIVQAVSSQAHVPLGHQMSVVSGIPLTADDIDLIEKQWVSKAKEIVEKTAQDPFLQTKEMNKFKAEYMKKRYNKDVKVTE